MKISKVKLSNFSILHDIEVDFQSTSRDMVFLNATNGGGKTTFQSALAWCIYGEPPEEGKFLSNYELNRCKIGTVIKVVVRIELNPDPEDGTTIIERVQAFEKNGENSSKLLGAASLSIQSRENSPGALTTPHPSPEYWLRKYFPQSLRGFFLFDGEKMTKFWEQDVKNDIEGAVKEIARVDMFESISKKMRLLESQKMRKIARKGGGKIEALEKECSDERKILESEKQDRDSLLKELGELQVLFKNLSSFLGESTRHKDDLLAFESLAREERQLLADLDKVKGELYVLVLELGQKTSIIKSFPALQSQVEKAQLEDWLPPPFEPERVKSLIDAEECICGSALKDGTPEVQKLKRLIERFNISSAVGKILEDTNRQTRLVSNSLDSDLRLEKSKTDHIKSLTESLKTVRERQAKIAERLQGIDVTEVDKVTVNFDNTHQRIVMLQSQEENLSKIMLKRAEKVRNLEVRIKEATKDDKEAKELSVEKDLCDQIASAADSIYSNAINQVRADLEQAIAKPFAAATGKEFRTEITEDFEVLTLLEDGKKAALAEGEKMLKGYIFSIALRDVIKLSLPLVVDTPFGRLGFAFRKIVATQLTSLMTGEKGGRSLQLIFSMHDTEYTPAERECFEKAKPLELYFTNDPQSPKDRSILGEGIDPRWLEDGNWRNWALLNKGKLK
jgi:DNA sulfur modification protein DndD